jgi:hypothetical protein
MEDKSEIEALRREVTQLRDELTALQRDVHRARTHIDLTMRGQLRCRACNCRRIAHAPHILDRSESFDHVLALYRTHRFLSSNDHGTFEAYVCTRCGLVEWWITNPSSLQPHEDHLEILDGDVEGPKDPYR